MTQELYRLSITIIFSFTLIHHSLSATIDSSLSVRSSNADDSKESFSFTKWLKEKIISDNPDDVRFFLFPKPSEKNYTEEIKYQDVTSLTKSGFRQGQKLKIVIHGFTKSYLSEGVQYIKNAYLEKQIQAGDSENRCNIILVDWEPLANPKTSVVDTLFYKFAVRNIPKVGTRVAEFVHFLVKNGAVKSASDDVHVIGFSLGAHVAGQAGRSIKELCGESPIRVTGLDPAGPGFYSDSRSPYPRLQNTDGRFVDIVHSNKGGMGTSEVYGHVDFFPNGGGTIQPRCEDEYEQKWSNKSFFDKEIWDMKFLALQSCSHNKAPEFYSMSITNSNMTSCNCENYEDFKSGACKCQEKAVFGEFCDSSTRGQFYLDI